MDRVKRNDIIDRKTKLILVLVFLLITALLWWKIFEFTEENWWGLQSPHTPKEPPKPLRIELMGLESINVNEALKEFSQKPQSKESDNQMSWFLID